MSKPAIKPADRRRFERFQDIGCICCRQHHGMYRVPEVHHLTAGGRRRGHQFTIPLCPWHHRGLPPTELGRAIVTDIYGPSLANSSKAFHAMYGSDEELLAATNKLLADRTAPPNGRGEHGN